MSTGVGQIVSVGDIGVMVSAGVGFGVGLGCGVFLHDQPIIDEAIIKLPNNNAFEIFIMMIRYYFRCKMQNNALYSNYFINGITNSVTVTKLVTLLL